MLNQRGPSPPALLAAGSLWLGLSGCLGMHDLDSAAVSPTGSAVTVERAAAVAEMRAQAAAGDTMPYPDAFQTEQTTRLAARPEPRTGAEVEAIEVELAAIAEQQAASTDPGEIAALEARARALRKLVLAAEAEPVRP